MPSLNIIVVLLRGIIEGTNSFPTAGIDNKDKLDNCLVDRQCVTLYSIHTTWLDPLKNQWSRRQNPMDCPQLEPAGGEIFWIFGGLTTTIYASPTTKIHFAVGWKLMLQAILFPRRQRGSVQVQRAPAEA